MIKRIRSTIIEGAELNNIVASVMSDVIKKAIDMCIEALDNGGKILLMGNGGSAADSQHIAAELVGRYQMERQAIPAVALSTDTSIITALGNDYGYDYIFKRQIEALGKDGDVAIGISTSGNSKNIYSGLEMARNKNIKTIGLLGNNGGKIKDICDLALIVPSDKTPRIQEIHITIGHIICEEIERGIFEK